MTEEQLQRAMAVPVHYLIGNGTACGFAGLGRRVTKISTEITCPECLRISALFPIQQESKTCDTCKFWRDQSSMDHFREGDCLCKSMEQGAYPLENGVAYGFGRFISGPKFGCVHWDRKSK